MKQQFSIRHDRALSTFGRLEVPLPSISRRESETIEHRAQFGLAPNAIFNIRFPFEGSAHTLSSFVFDNDFGMAYTTT